MPVETHVQGAVVRFTVVRFADVIGVDIDRDELGKVRIDVGDPDVPILLYTADSGYAAFEIVTLIANGVRALLAPETVELEPVASPHLNYPDQDHPVRRTRMPAGDLYDQFDAAGQVVEPHQIPTVMPPLIGEQAWKAATPKLIGEPAPWSNTLAQCNRREGCPSRIHYTACPEHIENLPDAPLTRGPAADIAIIDDPPVDLPKDERIAGGYGPGDPNTVIDDRPMCICPADCYPDIPHRDYCPAGVRDV